MISVLRHSLFLLVVLTLLTPALSCRPEPVASQDATVIVLQPSAGATIDSDSVKIRTYVENFHLADLNRRDNQSGEGHLIYYLDAAPPVTPGASALTQEGTYRISGEKSYIWERVPPGDHSFWVQLVNNDNTVLEPPAAVRVPVTIASR